MPFIFSSISSKYTIYLLKTMQILPVKFSYVTLKIWNLDPNVTYSQSNWEILKKIINKFLRKNSLIANESLFV